MKNSSKPVILLEGARKVPDHDIHRLRDLATLLAATLPKAVFRSGNAQGADSLFFQNLAAAAPERLEYILPYAGSGKRRIPARARAHFMAEMTRAEIETVAGITLKASPDVARLVEAFLAKGRNRLTVKAMYLLRDTMKVIGAPSLALPPADFGFFFVNADNPLAGGTGHTIRVCRAFKVPVFTQDEWDGWVTGDHNL